jgi:hypothetical protein
MAAFSSVLRVESVPAKLQSPFASLRLPSVEPTGSYEKGEVASGALRAASIIHRSYTGSHLSTEKKTIAEPITSGR